MEFFFASMWLIGFFGKVPIFNLKVQKTAEPRERRRQPLTRTARNLTRVAQPLTRTARNLTRTAPLLTRVAKNLTRVAQPLTQATKKPTGRQKSSQGEQRQAF